MDELSQARTKNMAFNVPFFKQALKFIFDLRILRDLRDHLLLSMEHIPTHTSEVVNLQPQLANDPLQRFTNGGIRGERHSGTAITIILIDQIIMGDNPQQLQALLFNFLPCSLIQLPIRRTVDDQRHTLCFQTQLLNELCDPASSLDTPAGAIADQDGRIHVGQQAPADMLQSGHCPPRYRDNFPPAFASAFAAGR